MKQTGKLFNELPGNAQKAYDSGTTVEPNPVLLKAKHR